MELEITTFYTQIKTKTAIDLRDNRGKVHSHGLVLVQFILALLCNRDGNLSRIHEHMERHYQRLVSFLGESEAPKRSISRAQLPLFLRKINYELLAFYVLKNVTFSVKMNEGSWYSIDGKELRGSIEKGSKRGEAIVQIVRHSDREVVGQSFYNGKKESEVPAVKKLLERTGIKREKVTLDALHLKPNSLELIDQSGGAFLVGLKGNQEVLFNQMEDVSYYLSPQYERDDKEKGHGREEERFYLSYDVSQLKFDKRWDGVNFRTMIKVIRKQRIARKGRMMYEESYYLSNLSAKSTQLSNELFDAVRGHWQIEVNNNIRDTVLKEDKFRSSSSFAARTAACCRTMVTRLLGICKPRNRRWQLDYFSDDFSACLSWLNTISFL